MLLNTHLTNFAFLKVLAVWGISVINAFPVADEDVTDSGEVKHKERLCLHVSQDVF